MGINNKIKKGKIQEISDIAGWFFEKIKILAKLQPKYQNKRERRFKLRKIKDNVGSITTDNNETQKITGAYFKI